MKSNKENPGIIEKRLGDERGLYDDRKLPETCQSIHCFQVQASLSSVYNEN